MSSEKELKILELIARMKSNLGDSQVWAKQLEEVLGIEEMQANL